MYEITAGDISVPLPVTLTAAVPTAAGFPTIVAGPVVCNPGETQLVADAYADLAKIISSTFFKQDVLAASFTENNGLTNNQIYDLLVSSSPIRVGFTMFTGSFLQNHVYHTMGYEDPAHPDICFANRYFIQTKEVCGSLILHESMHVLGFAHLGVKATSVPYTMNAIYTKVTGQLAV